MASAAPTAGDAPPPPPPTKVVVHRHPLRTAAKWLGIALLTILILFAAFVAWLNTDPGRRFIVNQINNFEAASGLKVQVGRIEGSIFGELTLHDVAVQDTQGTFFTAPRAELDYRPLSYFSNHIDIRSLVIPEARLLRMPVLRPGDPDAPLLPDMEIDVGRFRIERLAVDPAVTGQRHLLTIDSRIRIDEGRADVALDMGAIDAPGLPGGDRLTLRLDAVPEENRLGIDLSVRAPENGFIAGLAGLDQALVARLRGRGDWAEWDGRLQAMLGGEALTDLSVGARDGTFSLRGPVRTGLLLEGQLADLAGPMAQLDLITGWENRRADMRLRLTSPAVAIGAEGVVNLGENRFEGLRVATRLLRPGALAPNLSGRDVRLAMILDGPFGTPSVAYDLRAASLTFDATTLQGLRARGRARVRESGDLVVPVSAQAQRILGFDAVAGGPLSNVALDGELGVSGMRIVSDNLRLRSDRIDATLAIALDLEAGRYLAAIQGRVNNYLVDGVGLFDLNTDLDMTATAGGFGLSGRIAARTRRIDNPTIEQLLGGTGTISARIDMNAAGVVRVTDIRVNAPELRVTSGSGVYRPDGSIDFTLSGVSNAYGDLVVRITGTAASPNVQLRAANPGFGVGLRDVEATVRAVAGGWAIEASGESAYGPFTADVLIETARGPMAIRVNRLTFAGIDFEGRLVQTAAGPFAGTLTASGQGVNGTVRLAAEDEYQRIDLAVRASGARTPGDVPIILQRGYADATIILYPDAPLIVADAQVAGLASGDLFVDRARLHIDYRGGRGDAQLFAEGRHGVTFRIAANAAMEPELIRAALQGQVNGIDFRLAEPARVARDGDEWVLAPVTLALEQGRVRLAGRYGDGLVVQARLDALDLSIVNAFSPGLGIGGRATGSLDFAQPSDGSFPRAEARLNVSDFTRTGIALRSEPVDIAFAGSLLPQGGQAGAVIRRGGAVIGRMQARLQPLGPEAGPWTTRLLAAPLAGGIRYNGPADVPMSFANLAGHQLTGPLGIGVDFSGRVQDPQFTGVLRANNLTYVNEEYGTRVTNLAITGRFDASRLEIVQLSGRAGEGTVEGRGSIGLASNAGFPIDLRLQFANARLARSDDLAGTATGELAIVNDRQGARITGELTLDEARYQIVRQASEAIPQLTGVRRRGEPLPTPGEATAEGGEVPSIWNLDIRLRADNRVFVSGMGMESEWETDLTVTGTTATPRIVGEVELIRGTLSLAGRRFRLDEGQAVFTGARPPNPQIRLVAVTDIDGVEVAINVDGSANNPQIAFSSSPGLPQDEIVSRILFGSSVTEISALQAVQLAASLNSLRGSGGGLNPLGQLRSATGIDRLRILGADEATGRGTAISAGMYLSNDIYVEIVTDAKGFTATQLEIALSPTLSLLSQFGSNSGTNVNLRYSRDY